MPTRFLGPLQQLGEGVDMALRYVMLLGPAIRMIVKAPTLASPKRVSVMCLNECNTKSLGSFKPWRTFSLVI